MYTRKLKKKRRGKYKNSFIHCYKKLQWVFIFYPIITKYAIYYKNNKKGKSILEVSLQASLHAISLCIINITMLPLLCQHPGSSFSICHLSAKIKEETITICYDHSNHTWLAYINSTYNTKNSTEKSAKHTYIHNVTTSIHEVFGTTPPLKIHTRF